MSDRARSWTALAVIALSLGVVVTVLATQPPAPEDRVDALASRLKCPVCESESIADSPAQVARDSYELIAEQVAAGASDAEITDFFVATYGPSVLLDPPTGGDTAVLWIAPLAALGLGIIVIVGRRAGRVRQISDEERARVRAELETRR